MSAEELDKPEPVSICKICRNEYATVSQYNQHIDKYAGDLQAYADHGKQAADEPLPPDVAPQVQQVQPQADEPPQ
jgi:hypothetical protein